MGVVLPAAFGPSRPKQIPAGTLNEMPATAVAAGYILTRSRTSRMGVLTVGCVAGLAGDRRAILNHPRKLRSTSGSEQTIGLPCGYGGRRLPSRRRRVPSVRMSEGQYDKSAR